MEWVVAALPLLMEVARREGKTFLCADCARRSGAGATDESLILDLYGTYF